MFPNSFALIPFLLAEYHDTVTGGHLGFTKTYKRLASYFFGPQSWRTYANVMCQYNKYQATAPTGLLQPIHIPKIIWDDISLDFITEPYSIIWENHPLRLFMDALLPLYFIS